MDNEEQEKNDKKRRLFRALLLSGVFLIFASLCWLAWDNLRQNVWAYYTDEAGAEVGVEENKARFVLWEDPLTNPENVDLQNHGGERLEATFSPSGTSMILVRQDNNVTGMDMYLSPWNGRSNVFGYQLAGEELGKGVTQVLCE